MGSRDLVFRGGRRRRPADGVVEDKGEARLRAGPRLSGGLPVPRPGRGHARSLRCGRCRLRPADADSPRLHVAGVSDVRDRGPARTANGGVPGQFDVSRPRPTRPHRDIAGWRLPRRRMRGREAVVLQRFHRPPLGRQSPGSRRPSGAYRGRDLPGRQRGPRARGDQPARAGFQLHAAWPGRDRRRRRRQRLVRRPVHGHRSRSYGDWLRARQHHGPSIRRSAPSRLADRSKHHR